MKKLAISATLILVSNALLFSQAIKKIDSLAISKKYFSEHAENFYQFVEYGPFAHPARFSTKGLSTKSLGTPHTKPATISYANALPVSTAKNDIAAYDYSYLQEKNLFVFDADEISDYLNIATSGYSNYHLQFFLAYHNSKLALIANCVDDKGDDLYFNYMGGVPSILEASAKFPLSDRPFQPPTDNPSAYLPRYRNGLLYTSGNNLIYNYLNSQNTSGGISSFTIEADHFTEFIKKEKNAGANEFHFYLGDNQTNLVLIISGYKNTGALATSSYIYLGNGENKPCVYEHCDPCPVCDFVYDMGNSLE